jgi:hypothetical protein
MVRTMHECSQFPSAEIEVMLTIKNTNLTLVIPDESIAASLRK